MNLRHMSLDTLSKRLEMVRGLIAWLVEHAQELEKMIEALRKKST